MLLRVVDEAQGIAGHRFTGTARGWRGQGVALALKVALVRWAASSGVQLLRASNDDANAAMRAINARLGYQQVFEIAMFERPRAAGVPCPPDSRT